MKLIQTQITGDILFHSLPFAKDKSTILDYTLIAAACAPIICAKNNN
jgi:hypothetical protein